MTETVIPGVDLYPSTDLRSWELFDPNLDQGIRLETNTNPWKLVCSKLPGRFTVPLGRLAASDDQLRQNEETIDQIAERLANSANIWRFELVRWSPFWLDGLIHSEQIKERPAAEQLLILYRLAQICLTTLNTWKNPPEMQTTRLLLLRQRYRYLAGMQILVTDKKDDLITSLLTNYGWLIPQARQEYAQMLIDNTEEVELAFGAVKIHSGWNLDQEIRLLLFKPDGKLWKFAGVNRLARQLTDRIIQKWYLAQDDLGGTQDVLTRLLFKEPPYSLTARFFAHTTTYIKFSAMFGLGSIAWASLFDLSYNFQPSEILYVAYFLLVLSLVFLALVIFGVITAATSRRPLAFRQAFYPLAFRIPGMALVGSLAGAGLADAYIRYALTASNFPFASLVLMTFSLGAAFLYILFEVQARAKSPSVIGQRSLHIWSYGWSSTLLLTIFIAWLADPVGLTACKIGEDIGCISSGLYAGKIGLTNYLPVLQNRISLDYVLIVSTVSLMVGVFTQIFWEDKSIAEPL